MSSETVPVAYRFERIEKKFWMTREQYNEIIPAVKEHMDPDAHGSSLVCNIYYDTKDYALIRNSIERPLFKEKLRVRSYGVPYDHTSVFVEIKRKLNGIGYKRRIAVPFKEAKELLGGGKITSGDPHIRGELEAFIERYHPEPRVDIIYDRVAYYGKDDQEFRLTFDENLRYRLERPGSPGKIGMLPLMEDETKVLMEVKAQGGLPPWLSGKMSELGIYQAPFSKIGYCYTEHIAPYIKY